MMPFVVDLFGTLCIGRARSANAQNLGLDLLGIYSIVRGFVFQFQGLLRRRKSVTFGKDARFLVAKQKRF